MGEESKTRDVVDAVTGLAKAVPVYEDLLQPAAREIGSGLGDVASIIHVVLAPLRGLVWGYDQIEEWLAEALSARLHQLPKDRLHTPSPAVAGPALEALRFAAGEPALREMYANLLATAIDTKTADQAHPAFVEILKQLSRDEAKLFEIVADKRSVPVVELWADISRSEGGELVFTNFNVAVFDAGCDHPQHGDRYVDNLIRLGLAEVHRGFWIRDTDQYEPLEEHESVKAACEKVRQGGRTPRLDRTVMRVTALGDCFADACVRQVNRS